MSGWVADARAGWAQLLLTAMLSVQTCVCVSNVVPRLPASRAGLQAGDRILKVCGVGRGSWCVQISVVCACCCAGECADCPWLAAQ